MKVASSILCSVRTTAVLFICGAGSLMMFGGGGGGCAESAVIAAAGVTAGFGLAQGQAEAFINGELKAARMVPLEKCMQATLDAADELQVEIKTRRIGSHDAFIMARADEGPEVKVHLKAKSPVITKIEIRVGLMGDQAVSRLVLSRIDRLLGIEPMVVPVEDSPIMAPTTQPSIQPTTQSR